MLYIQLVYTKNRIINGNTCSYSISTGNVHTFHNILNHLAVTYATWTKTQVFFYCTFQSCKEAPAYKVFFYFRGKWYFFNCLAQKCTLPGQLRFKNKPFKISFWILKPMKTLTVTNSARSTLSQTACPRSVMGSVLKPVSSPG